MPNTQASGVSPGWPVSTSPQRLNPLAELGVRHLRWARAARTTLAHPWTPSSELGLSEQMALWGWQVGLWTGLPGGPAAPFLPLALCTELPTP